MTATQVPFSIEAVNRRLSRDSLASWMGYQLDELELGRIAASMVVDSRHIAPNGFLHGSVGVALADITCGYGSVAYLTRSEKVVTIELKTNYVGTALEGRLICKAVARHIGRDTHVWDADVIVEATEKPILLFRCTQKILRAR